MTPRPTSAPIESLRRQMLSQRLTTAWSMVWELAGDCAEEDQIELHEIASHLKRLAVAYGQANL